MSYWIHAKAELNFHSLGQRFTAIEMQTNEFSGLREEIEFRLHRDAINRTSQSCILPYASGFSRSSSPKEKWIIYRLTSDKLSI